MMDRRSFFAALAAPLLAPLRKLPPAALAQPTLRAGDVLSVNITARTTEFYTPKMVYISLGDRPFRLYEYGYWHGKLPFVFCDMSKLTVSAGKDTSA